MAPEAETATTGGTTGVRHAAAARRFEWAEEGETATLTYSLGGGSVVFLHTGTPLRIRGRGIAAKLVASGLAFAREHGLTVVPLCPYVASYIRRHPETLELVRPDWRERLAGPDPNERRSV
ncbi:MAG: N-acetyltransferase [Thermoanaerobaculia bacterium]|jgi:predicted GNAT family acetyltransferase|nr:N-acetyltransferase [Thermoanaerobaculia bacterium]MBP9822967.1 N-acetyltransferase [Thermoanaerobaculia bacterium]